MAERLTDADLDGIARWGVAIESDQQAMAAELLAYRQAARALVESVDTWRAAIEAGDGARAMKIAEQRASSLAALRALVKGE